MCPSFHKDVGHGRKRHPQELRMTSPLLPEHIIILPEAQTAGLSKWAET